MANFVLIVSSLLLLLVPLAVAAGPDFCQGLDCPRFTTVLRCNSSAGAWEVRDYPPQEWVSWNTSSISYDGVGDAGFHHLFKYISGQNAAGDKIDMTAPVTIDIAAGEGPNCNSTFTVSFFIPFKWQGKAPRPTGAGVYLRNAPRRIVAVRTFGGFVLGWFEVSLELQALAASLKAANASSLVADNGKLTATAEYDGPFQLFNRRNDVWIDLTSAPVSCN